MKNSFICVCLAIAISICGVQNPCEAAMIDANEVAPTMIIIREQPMPEPIEEIIDLAIIIEPQLIDENFDIISDCGYSEEQFMDALSGGYHEAMLPMIPYIMQAEIDYGVNALYLISKIGLESGWGKYRSAKNNVAGWTLDGGDYKDFDSVDECIRHVAKSLSTVYVESVGSKLSDVCGRYCPSSDEYIAVNDGYFTAISDIMIEIETKILT
ncbi:MAG: glucosaminidase domain-containing protein [Bacteroides sp.]